MQFLSEKDTPISNRYNSMAMFEANESSTAEASRMSDRGRDAARSVPPASSACEGQEEGVATGSPLGMATVVLERLSEDLNGPGAGTTQEDVRIGGDEGAEFVLDLASLPPPFSAGFSNEPLNYGHLTEEQYTSHLSLDEDDDMVVPPPNSGRRKRRVTLKTPFPDAIGVRDIDYDRIEILSDNSVSADRTDKRTCRPKKIRKLKILLS